MGFFLSKKDGKIVDIRIFRFRNLLAWLASKPMNRKLLLQILANKWLQYWRLSNEQEQLLFEEIVRRIREELQQKFWHVRGNKNLMIFIFDIVYNG